MTEHSTRLPEMEIYTFELSEPDGTRKDFDIAVLPNPDETLSITGEELAYVVSELKGGRQLILPRPTKEPQTIVMDSSGRKYENKSYFGGDLVLRTSDLSLCVNGNTYDLQQRTFKVLLYMMLHKNGFQTRRNIQEAAGYFEREDAHLNCDDALSKQIKRIRKLLENTSFHDNRFDIIRSKKRFGYGFFEAEN